MSQVDEVKGGRLKPCPDNCVCLCHDTGGGVHDHPNAPCPGKLRPAKVQEVESVDDIVARHWGQPTPGHQRQLVDELERYVREQRSEATPTGDDILEEAAAAIDGYEDQLESDATMPRDEKDHRVHTAMNCAEIVRQMKGLPRAPRSSEAPPDAAVEHLQRVADLANAAHARRASGDAKPAGLNVEQQDIDAAACWTNDMDPDASLSEAFARHRLRGMDAGLTLGRQRSEAARMCESCETRPAAKWCNGCIVGDYQANCGCAKCVVRDSADPLSDEPVWCRGTVLRHDSDGCVEVSFGRVPDLAEVQTAWIAPERLRRERDQSCHSLSSSSGTSSSSSSSSASSASGRDAADKASVEDSPCVHEWVAGRSKPIVCQHCGIRRAEWVAGQIRADQRSADGPLVMMRSAGHNEPDDHGAEDLLPVFVRCFACASQQPEAACSHWVGIGWSCTDRKACRVRRATPHDPPTPRQALDGLFNGAAMGLGGVNAAKLFNIARKALDDAQAEADRLRDVLRDFAEHDCTYGDGCPVFGSRHGRCTGCIARAALSVSAEKEKTR